MFQVEGAAYAEPCGRREGNGMRGGRRPVRLEHGEQGAVVRQAGAIDQPGLCRLLKSARTLF